MLLAARKDKVYIRQELDIGAQQSFYPFLRVFGNLLKLVDGNITPFLRGSQNNRISLSVYAPPLGVPRQSSLWGLRSVRQW